MRDLVEIFPAWNASLNALSGLLLLSGFIQMKRGHITAHKRLMISACIVSLLFLASYVTYHTLRGGVVTRFEGGGAMKRIYLAILTSHTILAVTIVPLAIITLRTGLKMRIPRHRQIARWTFPLWMYVSVTGVIVYFFLYHWFPSH